MGRTSISVINWSFRRPPYPARVVEVLLVPSLLVGPLPHPLAIGFIEGIGEFRRFFAEGVSDGAWLALWFVHPGFVCWCSHRVICEEEDFRQHFLPA
jgi:hypothetical protein